MLFIYIYVTGNIAFRARSCRIQEGHCLTSHHRLLSHLHAPKMPLPLTAVSFRAPWRYCHYQEFFGRSFHFKLIFFGLPRKGVTPIITITPRCPLLSSFSWLCLFNPRAQMKCYNLFSTFLAEKKKMFLSRKVCLLEQTRSSLHDSSECLALCQPSMRVATKFKLGKMSQDFRLGTEFSGLGVNRKCTSSCFRAAFGWKEENNHIFNHPKCTWC